MQSLANSFLTEVLSEEEADAIHVDMLFSL